MTVIASKWARNRAEIRTRIQVAGKVDCEHIPNYQYKATAA